MLKRSGKENFIELTRPELFDQASLASADECQLLANYEL